MTNDIYLLIKYATQAVRKSMRQVLIFLHGRHCHMFFVGYDECFVAPKEKNIAARRSTQNNEMLMYANHLMGRGLKLQACVDKAKNV